MIAYCAKITKKVTHPEHVSLILNNFLGVEKTNPNRLPSDCISFAKMAKIEGITNKFPIIPSNCGEIAIIKGAEIDTFFCKVVEFDHLLKDTNYLCILNGYIILSAPIKLSVEILPSFIHIEDSSFGQSGLRLEAGTRIVCFLVHVSSTFAVA